MIRVRESRVLVLLLAMGGFLAAQVLLGEMIGQSLHVLLLKYEALAVLLIVAGAFFYLGYKIYEPQFLWLLLTAMFLFGYVVLDLMGIDQFGRVRAFVVYTVSKDVEIRVLINLIIAVLAFVAGWMFFALRSTQAPAGALAMTASRQWQAIGTIGLIVLMPIVMKHYYAVFQFVSTDGYLAYQSRLGPTKGVLVYLAEEVMWLLFAMYLAGLPGKKSFFIVVVFIAIPLLLVKMFSGQRAFSMTMILALYWYWHWAYSRRARILLLIPIVWGAITLLTYIAAYRQGREYSFLVLPDLLLLFFNAQGVSVTTMLVGVQHAADLPLKDFGMDNVFAEVFMQLDKLGSRTFGGIPNTLPQDAAAYGYSGYLVTQALDSRLLSTGATVGTSYLLELYLLGREWAQALGGLVYGWLFHALYAAIRARREWLLLFLVLLPQLLFLPRASILSPISWNFISFGLIAGIFLLMVGRSAYLRVSGTGPATERFVV